MLFKYMFVFLNRKGKFSQQFVDLCELAAEKRKLHYYKLLAEILEEKSLITWKV